MATIVVAEDERDLNNLLKRHLEDEGHRVVQALDGPAAVLAAQRDRPDLLILDWMLPGLDGLEVCRRVRRESIVPILMLTARSEEIDRVLGLEVGADDYLTKPFSLEELVLRIEAILRRGRGRANERARITVGDLVLDDDAHRVWRAQREIELSPTEYRLLRYLMLNAG
ncbi:MAG: response regulator transcription factor, partial [Dehalococcoidia bacterium]